MLSLFDKIRIYGLLFHKIQTNGSKQLNFGKGYVFFMLCPPNNISIYVVEFLCHNIYMDSVLFLENRPLCYSICTTVDIYI